MSKFERVMVLVFLGATVLVIAAFVPVITSTVQTLIVFVTAH